MRPLLDELIHFFPITRLPMARMLKQERKKKEMKNMGMEGEFKKKKKKKKERTSPSRGATPTTSRTLVFFIKRKKLKEVMSAQTTGTF